MSEWLLTMEFSEIEPQTLSSYEGETRKKLEDFFAEEHLSHIYRYSYDEVHVIQFVMDKEAFRFWNGIFYVETPSLEETTKNALENVGVVFTYTKKLEDHFYYFEE